MRSKRRGALGLAAGLLLGLLLASRRQVTEESQQQQPTSVQEEQLGYEQEADESLEQPEGGLLYVGVMTARKYLGSRARAVADSWGREVPGRLVFYSSAGSRAPGLPLVGLSRVDDSYPPQKKSFLMLAHMWQRHGQRYEWFMRADDDVYVRMGRLERLLRSLDSRRPAYIGQAGRGNSLEFGLLSLEYDENFCMGGPGVLLSRETLRRLVPHIKRCLANLYTTHEDVELGRCVRRAAGIPCTWNYEMQSILYHNSSGQLAFTGDLNTKEVHRAISLHPVKSPPHMYRLHNYMRGLDIQELQQQRLQLRDDVEGSKATMSAEEKRLAWDFVSRSEYSLAETNPRRRIRGDVREGLQQSTREVMASINACSRQRGRFVEERQALYAYHARHPRRGALAVLDLLLMYKKYRGRKLSLPVRRHLYLRRRFTGIEMRWSMHRKEESEQVHLVLPVRGRGEALRRFLDNFERVCLATHEHARLIVVQYPSDDGQDWTGLEARVRQLHSIYGSQNLQLVHAEGRFSRARALERGLSLLSDNDLALLIDVDIELSSTRPLERARRNAILGRSVYFPVVLSEFAPQLRVDAEAASWRQFGFGIVALHKRDYEAAGRLDLRIEGWGREDVDLFEKTLRAPSLRVFRAADPHLLHRYHEAQCRADELSSGQLRMCLGSRADTFASAPRLAGLLLQRPDYLRFARRRNVTSDAA